MIEGSLNVDSVDKSLLFSISFTMEAGSLLSNLQMFTLKFSLKLMHRKGWGTCRSPKSYNLSPDCPPCLVLFKMADKISMSQQASQVSDISLTM